MDFRRGVKWVARFLRLALRSPDREYRAEALEELRKALTPGELRKLAAWAEGAATAASDSQGAVA